MMKQPAILDRIAALVAEADALVDQACTDATDEAQANALLTDAMQRVAAARALLQQYRRRRRQKHLAMQYGAGIFNACAAVLGFANGHYWSGALSLACMVLISRLKMPE